MVYVRDENVPTFAQAIEHFSEALEIVMSVRADYNLPESSWGPSD